MSSAGRPNIYVEIVRDLGGVATASQIFAYGCKNGMLTGTYESCKSAIWVNIRKGKLIGKMYGEIMVAPSGTQPPLRKKKTVTRAKYEEPLNNVMNRLSAQGSFAVALEAKMDRQFSELLGRLETLERHLNALEDAQRPF